MKNTLLLGFLLAIAALVVGCQSSAPKPPRLVLLPVKANKSLGKAVSKTVKGEFDLVSYKRFSSTAKELDAQSMRSKDVRAVARELVLDAVVDAELVKKRRRKYELLLTVRAGYSGREYKTVAVTLSSKKLKEKHQKKLIQRLGKALQELREDKAEYLREKKEKKARKKKEKDKRKRDRQKASKDSDEKKERSKRRSKKRKKEKRDKEYDHLRRDDSGQAIDDENPL